MNLSEIIQLVSIAVDIIGKLMSAGLSKTEIAMRLYSLTESEHRIDTDVDAVAKGE